MTSSERTTARVVSSILAVSIAVVLTLGLGVLPASAAAPAPTCGATLTSSVTLTKYLTCRSGDGVTLAKGVILDLGGHFVTGNANGTAVTFDPSGTSNLKNGTIANWGTGFLIYADDDSGPATGITKVKFVKAPGIASGGTLQLTSATLDRSPINLTLGEIKATATTFITSDIDGVGGGIAVDHSAITNSAFGTFEGLNVTIDSSVLDGAGGSSAVGCDTTITNSTVRNYAQPIVHPGCYSSLTGNSFTDNPGGVVNSAGQNPDSVDVTNNTFTRSGIAVQGTRKLTVTGNVFTGNVTGVYIQSPKDFGDTKHGTQTNSVVTGNVFTGNSSSGIRSTATKLSIGANNATNNGRYGIYSPGATDLDKNIASGNAAGNCTGVKCAAK